MKDEDYKYAKNIPSPVALDYPYRNLTRIVGAIPSSLSVDETKNRINDYYKGIVDEKLKYQEPRINELAKNPWAQLMGQKQISDDDIAWARKKYISELLPIESFRKLQNDITNAYLDDISKNEKDLNKLKDIIAKDLGWSDLDKSLVNIDLNNPRSRETDITGDIVIDDRHPSPKIPRIFVKSGSESGEQISPRSTLFHEMLHADNALKNEPMRFYSFGHFLPEYNEEYVNSEDDQLLKELVDKNKLIDQDPFTLSNVYNSTLHHMPIKLKGQYEPSILMRPFVKAGMPTENTILNELLNSYSATAPDHYIFEDNKIPSSFRWRTIKKLLEEN